MEVREQRMWQSILSALDSPKSKKVWAIMVVGTNDYTWYYTVVELPDYIPYSEMEDKATKTIRLQLQESNIHPSFVKMKSLTHDRDQVRLMLGTS